MHVTYAKCKVYIYICINSAMNDVCDHIILACITHH